MSPVLTVIAAIPYKRPLAISIETRVDGGLLGLRTNPLRDAGGESPAVSLNGLQTLRLPIPDPAGEVSINYLVPVPAEATPITRPILTSLRISEGLFSFDFQSQPDTTYTVEFRTSLPGSASDTWQQHQPIVGDGAIQSFTHSPATPTGLFRVAVP